MPKAQRQLKLEGPWTTAKQAALTAENETMIWLLVDIEEAEVLTHGQVPEAVAEMCEQALKGIT